MTEPSKTPRTDDLVERLDREATLWTPSPLTVLLREAIVRISEAPEMPRWIPVEERLPSGYDRCLAHPSNYKYDRNPTAVYSPSTGKWTQTDSNGYDCEIPVTHWMPLPEAPK